jgi:hypothetical protein
MCSTVKNTIYMEQSPSWYTSSHSVSQNVHRLLWNIEIYYRIQATRHSVLLSQFNIVYNLHNENFIYICRLRHSCYMSTHFILLDLIILTADKVFNLYH